MSGSIENRATGTAERANESERILTWQASQAMLPLVGRIARDIADQHQLLVSQRQELGELDRQRHTLAWPQRSRRYQLDEEVIHNEARLKQLVLELDSLGVALLDEALGLVGFPTMVNQRRAYFSWQPGEEAIVCWNYAGDLVRRPVPVEWTRPEAEPRPRSRTRPRRK